MNNHKGVTPFAQWAFCLLLVSLIPHESNAIRVKTDGVGLGEAEAVKHRKGYYRRSSYEQDWNTQSGYEGANMGIGGTRYDMAGGGGGFIGPGQESDYGFSGGYGSGIKGDGGYTGGTFGYDRGQGGEKYPPIGSDSYFPSGVYPPSGTHQPGGGPNFGYGTADGGSYGSGKGFPGGYPKGYDRPRPPTRRGKRPKTRVVFIEVPVVHVVPVPVPSRPVKKPRPTYKGAPYPGYNKGFGGGGGYSGSENTGFEIKLSIGRPNTGTYKGGQTRGSTYSKGW